MVGIHLNYLNKFIKAYVVDTHLNCIDKSMEFKWEPTTYALIIKAYVVGTHLNCIDKSVQFKWEPRIYAIK